MGSAHVYMNQVLYLPLPRNLALNLELRRYGNGAMMNVVQEHLVAEVQVADRINIPLTRDERADIKYSIDHATDHQLALFAGAFVTWLLAGDESWTLSGNNIVTGLESCMRASGVTRLEPRF